MGYDLQGKVVLITGASSGIGRATAVEFHRAGSRVVVAARSKDKLDALAAELGGDRVLAVKMDVTSESDRTLVLEKSREAFGSIDVLVNNAGWASFGTVQRIPMANVEKMVALNLIAPIALAREVIPEMLERGSGQIINISSVVGFQAIPRMTVYSATKAALNGFTTGLRMELKGTGIDVLLVAPGSTNTSFFDVADAIDAKASRVAETQYTPQRVALAVVASSRKRRREVVLTADGKMITWIRRFSPRVADLIMYGVAKKGMPLSKAGSA